jgi:hypothetical protein
MPSSISLKSAESSAKRRRQKGHLARFGIIRDSACDYADIGIIAAGNAKAIPTCQPLMRQTLHHKTIAFCGNWMAPVSSIRSIW